MKNAPLKILLIEDSASDAALLNAMLKQVTEFEFDMDHAPELASGVRKLAESEFDVVILDLGLPDSVGIESYKKIRACAQRLPIIVMSGNHDRLVMAEIMNEGADNYLVKEAFDGNRVAIAVLSAIRNRLTNLADKSQ